MSINGVALAGIAGGSLLLYSAIKGTSILATIPALIQGKSPASVPMTNPINAGALGGISTPAINSATGLPISPAVLGTTGSGSAGSSVAQYQAYAFSLFPQFGWNSSQEQPLISLWNQESGWSPTAQNASSAYGIAQFLDSTWAPYGPKTSDPSLQIKYGLEYIRDRYGSPAAAWAFENSHSPAWY
jgi:hypothetical protein